MRRDILNCFFDNDLGNQALSQDTGRRCASVGCRWWVRPLPSCPRRPEFPGSKQNARAGFEEVELMRLTAILLALITVLMIAGTTTVSNAATNVSPPRYQWYSGHWWYWMPDNHWVYWDHNRWNDYRPRMTLVANPVPQTSPQASNTAAGSCPTSYGSGSASSDSWSRAAVGSWGGYYFGR